MLYTPAFFFLMYRFKTKMWGRSPGNARILIFQGSFLPVETADFNTCAMFEDGGIECKDVSWRKWCVENSGFGALQKDTFPFSPTKSPFDDIWTHYFGS